MLYHFKSLKQIVMKQEVQQAVEAIKRLEAERPPRWLALKIIEQKKIWMNTPKTKEGFEEMKKLGLVFPN
jgi:Fe2+ transport system protein B